MSLRVARSILRRWERPGPPLADHAAFLHQAYTVVLGRAIDSEALDFWLAQLEDGSITRVDLVSLLVGSAEFAARKLSQETPEQRGTRALQSLHQSRVQAVIGLPRAQTIVDLGGSWEGKPEGALVVMGYPYPFERLSIVELPRPQRHELYSNICGDYHDPIATALGPVRYVYTSLADLSPFADSSVDLVYSGQSIEHVSCAEAACACREVYRILKPGGYFCLDTPNRAVTRLQSPQAYINPDHQHEYTHPEISSLLGQHGLEVIEAKGLNRAAQSVAQERFLIDEIIDHPGMFEDIENCYLLYYKCQKPIE